MALYKLKREREMSEESQHLDLGFPYFEKISLYCLSNMIGSILLWQYLQINTVPKAQKKFWRQQNRGIEEDINLGDRYI